MALTIPQRNAAAHALNVGAIGLGEEHTEPDARSFAIELIKTGLVRFLMVELAPGTYQAQVDAAVQRGGGLHLVTKNRCPVSLHDVINTAIAAGVPVHCVDSKWANHRDAHQPAKLKVRNREVGQNFQGITGAHQADAPGAQGCLILFGGAHFEGPDAIQTHIPNLHICMAG
jgi:hypothetical protein